MLGFFRSLLLFWDCFISQKKNEMSWFTNEVDLAMIDSFLDSNNKGGSLFLQI
jgi:hypothetical protein